MLIQKEDALKLWGEPKSIDDVTKLFSDFCAGKLTALPWSDQAPASETSIISSQLARMNELGFLTINSQPAVNGARSNDKVFGWGPSNGFVYQKVRKCDCYPILVCINIDSTGIPRILRQPGLTKVPVVSYR